MQLLRMFHTSWPRNRWQTRHWHALRLFCAASIALLAAPLTACSQDIDDSRSTRRAIAQSQAIAADFLQTELAMSPETATRLGMERTLGRATKFALDNYSQAGFERRRLVRIELLQRLRQRPRLPSGHNLVVDLAIAERALTDLIALEQLGYGRFNYRLTRPYAIDPYSGIWIEGPQLLAFRQSINTSEEASAFVTRLQSLSEALQDSRRRLLADRASGIRIPAPLLRETRDKIGELLSLETSQLDEIAFAFNALTRDVADLEPTARDALVDLVEFEIRENLRTAYADLEAVLVEEASEGSDRIGIWAQPNGADLFIGILKASTGVAIPIDRLHERHLEDVSMHLANILASFPSEENDLEAELDPNPQPLSLADGFAALMTRETESGVGLGEASETDLSPTLADLAPGTVWIDVENRPPFPTQAVALQSFGALWNSPPYAEWRTTPTETYHPARSLLEFPAIQDAWRIYIWMSAVGEPDRAEVSHAMIALLHANFAAVDTGIHIERWSFEEATSFLETHTGLSSNVTRELVLRIASQPGYHSSTMAALHRFQALSERARAVLGDRYSESDFIRTLIEKGPRPLDFIEQDVEAWYGQKLAN